MSADEYDLVVVGGGIMGCETALATAAGGMRVCVAEKSGLCSGASGVNAGTLSLQIKRVHLIPYALKGHALWAAAGDSIGYRRTGGFTLAFNASEADLLEERMVAKRGAGAPIEMVSVDFVKAREPAVSAKIVAASWCAEDGYANSSMSGAYYRSRLRQAGVSVQEHSQVSAIDRRERGFSLVTPTGVLHAKRVLLACGAWLQQAGRMLGADLPVHARVNTVSVTDRMPHFLNGVIGHATGMLTLKQKADGTVLIGGGWQGTGVPERTAGTVLLDTLLPNLGLACFVVPQLAKSRLVRSWTGYEGHTPDFYPLAGPAPGVEGAFVLGCVRGGYTIGPYIGRLMGQLILGEVPELPLFDPARFLETRAADLHAAGDCL